LEGSIAMRVGVWVGAVRGFGEGVVSDRLQEMQHRYKTGTLPAPDCAVGIRTPPGDRPNGLGNVGDGWVEDGWQRLGGFAILPACRG